MPLLHVAQSLLGPHLSLDALIIMTRMMNIIRCRVVYCLESPIVMVNILDQELIEQTEEICAARGVRFTPQRKQVFQLIVLALKHQVLMNC